ncbi:c-type cytochrome [Puniceicoccaceae bacterium K14]|nr:c-type cytochrome [Puniceicoccaceae bacterium K14]
MKEKNISEEPIRHHSYDGIQEFDKNLPRWWLMTLYGTVVFAVAYWIYYQQTGIGLTQGEELELALATIEDAKAEALASADEVTDESLWAMSLNTVIVEAGKQVYTTTCAACHGPNLEGGIGVSLADAEWVHGGNPLDIRKTVYDGSLAKGMPAWGPVLGDERVDEVVAYVLSHHSAVN